MFENGSETVLLQLVLNSHNVRGCASPRGRTWITVNRENRLNFIFSDDRPPLITGPVLSNGLGMRLIVSDPKSDVLALVFSDASVQYVHICE